MPSPTDPTEPAPAPSWCYPGALRLTLRRALADTRADTVIPPRRRARALATYQKMLALLDTLESGRGRPTLKETFADDSKRREVENGITDALIRLGKRHEEVNITSLSGETLMPRKMLTRYLDALGYGRDPRFW
jgi:hypothetical protein